LIGAISLCRLNEIRSIPYLHDPLKYFNENGEIAYVSLFVVAKGNSEDEIAEQLYLNAEKRALEKGCSKIVVVIYSSPIEIKILRKFGYEVEIEDAEWEIDPDMQVRCNIWSKTLSG
ncbi:hypothetical protein JW978_04265, partial [Candidatus Dojkabacteria bacterium]|nr:hypothetical protein [Candidatus Dojkabacteria bacterium]